MPNKYLTREDAPVEKGVWDLLDTTALEAAKSVLSGRRIMDIDGPFGLGLKAIALSDPEVESTPLTSPVMPLALISKSFTIAKRDLASFERGGTLLDTRGVANAAMECARAEDEMVFKGTKEAPGLLSVKGASQKALSSWSEIGTAADDIIKAITTLDEAGFHGPYALALAPARYNLLLRRYPTDSASELQHVATMAMAGVVKAPALESGGVLLAAGRQYATIVLGQDMSVGFIGPVGERLEFSISESLSSYIRVPGAVCVLKG
jgi:uncharacterized linocin/CFP29 family protein